MFFSCAFAILNFTLYLCTRFSNKTALKMLRRDGRVVDYNGLENRRAERHRGFESLSLRHLMKREPYGFPFFVPGNQLLAFLTH